MGLLEICLNKSERIRHNQNNGSKSGNNCAPDESKSLLQHQIDPHQSKPSAAELSNAMKMAAFQDHEVAGTMCHPRDPE